jgi:hypothetical protein
VVRVWQAGNDGNAQVVSVAGDALADSIYLVIENLGHSAWSNFNGFASKDGRLFCSTRALEYQKFQITNRKYQTNHNDQNSKFETCFLFWSLNIGI